MKMTSTLKKTISTAALLALSNTSAMANITTRDQALDELTGPNQDMSAPEEEMCVSVDPYFLTSMTPTGVASMYYALTIDGIGAGRRRDGKCGMPEHVTGLCERGFIKIKTTANVACTVPIAL